MKSQNIQFSNFGVWANWTGFKQSSVQIFDLGALSTTFAPAAPMLAPDYKEASTEHQNQQNAAQRRDFWCWPWSSPHLCSTPGKWEDALAGSKSHRTGRARSRNVAARVHTSSVRGWVGLRWLVGRVGAGADFAAGWIPAGARAPTGLLLPPDPAGGLPIVRAQPHPHPPTLVTNTLPELLVNLWVSARFRNPPSFPARSFEERRKLWSSYGLCTDGGMLSYQRAWLHNHSRSIKPVFHWLFCPLNRQPLFLSAPSNGQDSDKIWIKGSILLLFTHQWQQRCRGANVQNCISPNSTFYKLVPNSENQSCVYPWWCWLSFVCQKGWVQSSKRVVLNICKINIFNINIFNIKILNINIFHINFFNININIFNINIFNVNILHWYLSFDGFTICVLLPA